MDEAESIYRGEVLAMIGALADIYTDTSRILAILDPEEDDGEAQEMDS